MVVLMAWTNHGHREAQNKQHVREDMKNKKSVILITACLHVAHVSAGQQLVAVDQSDHHKQVEVPAASRLRFCLCFTSEQLILKAHGDLLLRPTAA